MLEQSVYKWCHHLCLKSRDGYNCYVISGYYFTYPLAQSGNALAHSFWHKRCHSVSPIKLQPIQLVQSIRIYTHHFHHMLFTVHKKAAWSSLFWKNLPEQVYNIVCFFTTENMSVVHNDIFLITTHLPDTKVLFRGITIKAWPKSYTKTLIC